jgi:hypothetical protein
LCIAHGEEVDQSTVDPAFRGFNIDVFIDLILIWQPDRKLNILVSHASIKECIAEILHTLSIKHASLDQLESSLTLEEMNTYGIPADKHNINDDDYIRLKGIVEANRFHCPVFPLLSNEMENVQYFPNRHRIDHTSDGSKDVLDTICQAARILYTKNLSMNLNMHVGGNPFSLHPDSEGETTDDLIKKALDWSYLIPGYNI